MWGKLSTTQRVILIGIAVLIVVDIILWGNVAKLKNPVSRFEDAINAGNVTAAVASYKDMQGSTQKTNRFNAEKLAIKYCRIRLGEYVAGEANYDSVSRELYTLQEEVLSKDKQIGGYIETMEAWKASEEAYANGIACKENEEYEEAIEYFEQVSPDYSGYQQAQTEIEDCEKLIEARAGIVIEQALAMINIQEDIRTYLEAVKILDAFMAKHPDDNFVKARREQFLDEYYNIQLKNIETMIINDAEEEALDLAKELKELRPERKEAGEYIDKLNELLKEKEKKDKKKKK